MTATVFFQSGTGADTATLQNTFQVSGVATDPTTVSCVITDPTGTATTHTYLGAAPADITKVSTGVYQLNIPCTITGLWGYVWIGTGTASDIQPGTFTVNPSSTLQNYYTSVEEMKDRLNINDTQSDLQLQICVRAAAKSVEQYTGRHFYQVTEPRVYVPYSIYEQPIRDLANTTGLSVNVDTTGNSPQVFDQAWTLNVDYELAVWEWEFITDASGEPRPYTWMRAINAVGGGKFWPYTWPFSRLDRIQVTGTWGWPAVPDAIKMATQQTAAELFKLKDAPFGLAGVSEIGLVRVPRQNPYITKLLQPYVWRRKVGI